MFPYIDPSDSKKQRGTEIDDDGDSCNGSENNDEGDSQAGTFPDSKRRKATGMRI